MRDRSPDGKSTYLDQSSFDSARTRLSSIAFLHFFDSEVDINTIFPRYGDVGISVTLLPVNIWKILCFLSRLSFCWMLDEQEIP